MGLKKDVPEVVGEAGKDPAAAATPTPPPEAHPTDKEADKKPAAKAAPGKKGVTLMLLAVKRPISDPTTGVLYDKINAKPGIRKVGNWIYSQMRVGILIERVPPAHLEEE